MRRLQGHWSRGPSRLRAEHLWDWIKEHWRQEAAVETEDEGVMLELVGRERGTKDRRKDGGEAIKHTKWEMSVELTHTELREGELAEEAAWKAVVLIPKVGGD